MESEKKPFILRLLKRRKLLLIIFVILAVIGFSYYKIVSRRNAGVQTAKVEKGTVSEELVLSGEINADEYTQLSFPTSGEISWVGVKEGDKVKKGQSLSKLDTTILNSTFQQAQATLRAAEATVENIHDQVKDHSGDETYSQKDTRTTAEAAKDKAYEAYIQAEYNLRNSTLIAPFTGIITYLAHPFPGVNILVTEPQIELINPDTIYFDVSADQNDVVNLSVGQPVSVSIDSLPDETIDGEISFISYTPKSGEAGTVYKIKVMLEGNDLDAQKVRIGMSGDAHFIINKKDNVLYVPPKFINTNGEGKYLNVGSLNNRVYIEVGIEGEDRVEIISDKVKEGETVFD
jgi:RND family efflux transporter MFP subunit